MAYKGKNKLEDTKDAWIEFKYSDQKKNDNQTNIDLQNTRHKTMLYMST